MGTMTGKIKNNLYFGHGGSSDQYENIFVIFLEKKRDYYNFLTNHSPIYIILAI